MPRTSHIQLDKHALNNNIQYLRTYLEDHTRFSMVIKANAYGHGIDDIVPLAEDCGVDHFSVFSAAEAKVAHRAMSGECDLMIMGWIDKDQMKWVIENGLSFFVFTLDRLQAVCEVAEQVGKAAKIHLEVETGMHRTGFYRKDLEKALEIIKAHPDCFEVEGICTHYAGAESIGNYDRIKQQIHNFHKICNWVEEQEVNPRYRHTACSAALLNYPETAMDLVRVGIASYGFWPNDETRMHKLMKVKGRKDPLARVLTWKSQVMSVNEVGEGEYVSYGKSYLTNRPTLIATIPVGYSYGFSRTLSNTGFVLIRGKRVPVIGAVNMNMMTVDVTDLKEVKEGDEVVMIGNQGKQTITVSSFSDMNNSMNYESLTRLPDHLPRRVV